MNFYGIYHSLKPCSSFQVNWILLMKSFTNRFEVQMIAHQCPGKCDHHHVQDCGYREAVLSRAENSAVLLHPPLHDFRYCQGCHQRLHRALKKKEQLEDELSITTWRDTEASTRFYFLVRVPYAVRLACRSIVLSRSGGGVRNGLASSGTLWLIFCRWSTWNNLLGMLPYARRVRVFSSDGTYGSR